MTKSNYEITRDLMEQEFCKYDQQRMIEKFTLQSDERYLYIDFVGLPYRIDRVSGKVERGGEDFSAPVHADYNETMSIFDLLCYSKEDCRLAGSFCAVNRLKGTVQASALGNSFHQPYADFFDKHPQALENALLRLGGERETVGDISFRLYPFRALPIIFQFWHADEDFPASVKLLWDENTLDFMHYETTYFVAGHLMRRLKEMIEK